LCEYLYNYKSIYDIQKPESFKREGGREREREGRKSKKQEECILAMATFEVFMYHTCNKLERVRAKAQSFLSSGWRLVKR